jgi:hypothetical protein
MVARDHMMRKRRSPMSQNQSSGQETTLVPNEIYDLITALSSKLEGIAAYQKFQRNGSANDQIWQQLQQQDEQAVRTLMQQLDQFAQQGKLRI